VVTAGETFTKRGGGDLRGLARSKTDLKNGSLSLRIEKTYGGKKVERKKNEKEKGGQNLLETVNRGVVVVPRGRPTCKVEKEGGTGCTSFFMALGISEKKIKGLGGGGHGGRGKETASEKVKVEKTRDELVNITGNRLARKRKTEKGGGVEEKRKGG